MIYRFAILAVALAVTACSNVDVQPAEVNPTDMPKGPGVFSGKSGNLLDAFRSDSGGILAGEGGGTIGVNVYLWRASLESVGFMPLLQADSNGGVIITDWYTSPENPDERVKVHILILGKSLRADAIKATVSKQQKSGNDWVDQPSDTATARKLEDIILTKARAIKVQSLSE